MSKGFYTVKVKDIRKETSDCVSIEFDIPSDLQSQFNFIAGQYLTLKTTIDGKDVRRAYSLCSGTYENSWRVAVKKVENGLFSTYANDRLSIGDEIEISTPAGNFKHDSEGKNNNSYVAFAAGSGITPIISIVKSVLNDENESSFVLFYGNKSANSTIFRNELDDLKIQYKDRLSIHYIFSQESVDKDMFNGRLDGIKCREYANSLFEINNVTNFYLCGPEQMIMTVTDELKTLGAVPERVQYELFTASAKPQSTTDDVEELEGDFSGEAEVIIILDDEEYSIKVKSEGKSILERGIEEDLDVPFSCQAGVCCTCKAKLIEGKVHIVQDHALEDDEKEAGFFLSCQAYPRSAKLIVDFDV